jgi:hypothetical protein
MPALVLNGLLRWAFLPVAVPNGNKLGRLRLSLPMGKRAF